MIVRALSGAERDLERIFDHIAIDDPAAARGVVRRIRERFANLAEFPEQGRRGRAGRRALVIAGTPYLVIYRIAGDTVFVLRVRHGRQLRRAI